MGGVHPTCVRYLKVSDHGLCESKRGWFLHPRPGTKEGPDDFLQEEPSLMDYGGNWWLPWTSSPRFLIKLTPLCMSHIDTTLFGFFICSLILPIHSPKQHFLPFCKIWCFFRNAVPSHWESLPPCQSPCTWHWAQQQASLLGMWVPLIFPPGWFPMPGPCRETNFPLKRCVWEKKFCDISARRLLLICIPGLQSWTPAHCPVRNRRVHVFFSGSQLEWQAHSFKKEAIHFGTM